MAFYPFAAVGNCVLPAIGAAARVFGRAHIPAEPSLTVGLLPLFALLWHCLGDRLGTRRAFASRLLFNPVRWSFCFCPLAATDSVGSSAGRCLRFALSAAAGGNNRPLCLFRCRRNCFRTNRIGIKQPVPAILRTRPLFSQTSEHQIVAVFRHPVVI